MLNYLKDRRWFGGKARTIKSCRILEHIYLPLRAETVYALFVRVTYTEGDPETYFLPLAFATGERAARLRDDFPQAVVTPLHAHDEDGVVYDALWDIDCANTLLEAIAHHRRPRGDSGEMVASLSRAFKRSQVLSKPPGMPTILRAEQSNTSIAYGDRFILKVFRRLDSGMNPDLEIGRFLTEKKSFAHIPPVVGAIEYSQKGREPITLAILQGFVPNQGDAWKYTLDILGNYFERALTQRTDSAPALAGHKSIWAILDAEVPASVGEIIGAYLENARLLGQRTAELHVALASEPSDPAFSPEPFTPHYQRSIYQAMTSQVNQVFRLLQKSLRTLTESEQKRAAQLLGMEKDLTKRFRAIFERKITAMRIRTHGNYNLRELLFTGKDFVIIDFEGEPARPISERRIKRSPLRDVAGMLRSFHYATQTALRSERVRPEDAAAAEAWAHLWQQWISAAFLQMYLLEAAQGEFLPKSREELRLLLELYLVNKAVYEIGYELNNRPSWVGIPIQGLLDILQATD